MELSGCIKMCGYFRISTASAMIVIANLNMSFSVTKGWNGILSVFLFNPSGLFDPVWCKNSN